MTCSQTTTASSDESLRSRWATLSTKQQDKILDKHRYIEGKHYDWWDITYEDFKNDMIEIGICVEEMYFSGFWSQGDGACFKGCVDTWPLFLDKQNLPNRAVFDAAVDIDGLRSRSLSCKQSGYYMHEYCTSFTYEVDVRQEDEFEPGDLRRHAIADAVTEYEKADFEEVFTKYFRDQMRELYRRLEAEHDRLTSDESVLESLIANDMLEDELNELEEEDVA